MTSTLTDIQVHRQIQVRVDMAASEPSPVSDESSSEGYDL